MRAEFPGYYHPTDDDFKQLWKSCLFVFDANVLLNLYRYPEEAKNDLLKVLKIVSKRIWLPHQAALEYQANRLSVIADQVQRFSQVRKIVRDTEASLKTELQKLQLEKRHSSIKVNEFLDSIASTFTSFLSTLDPLESKQQNVNSEDPIRFELDDLYTSPLCQDICSGWIS